MEITNDLTSEQWTICFKESQEELLREHLQRQMAEDEKLKQALFPRKKLATGQEMTNQREASPIA